MNLFGFNSISCYGDRGIYGYPRDGGCSIDPSKEEFVDPDFEVGSLSAESNGEQAFTSAPSSLEQALAAHEEQVDVAIKAAARFLASVKAWKKACQTGHIGNRQKAEADAEKLALQLQCLTSEAAASWQFDVRAYLESNSWRKELQAACSGLGLRVLEKEETLVSSPILVRAQPGHSRLQLGKNAWPTLHPKVTAAELKRLNERSASTTAMQQFLNYLYDGCKKESQQGDLFARFRALYDLFALAPGWAKENPPDDFAERIYTLHRSDVRTTRDGRTFEFEGPSGKPKDKDIFSVISDDGRPIRYYGIWFK